MKDHFLRLFAHLAWADKRVLDGLRSAHAVLKSIMDLYCHILGPEHVWLSRIKGEEPRYAVWPTLTLDECATLGAENVREFEKLLKATDAAGFARMITYRNSAGDQFTSSLED